MTTMAAIGSFNGLPIDEAPDLDLVPLKDKSITWHWQFMFTQTIDDFSAAGLREAHRAVESGRMIGKVVVHR